MSDLPRDRVVRHFCDRSRGAVHPIKWKAKYGGLEVSELVRVKELESENSRLKRMYAELALENEAIKGLLKKL
jgi:hypothetical protein